MLMVVFGAGASYDSVPGRSVKQGFPRGSLNYRPPLADELFADSPEFVDPIKRFPMLHRLLPRLRHIPEGRTVEAELGRLQAEGVDDPERVRQLAAVRCYLHYLIWDFTRRWEDEVAHSATNYKTLTEDIRRWLRHGNRACLVTFNYDTLLESALPILGLKVNRLGYGDPYTIDEFVAHDHVKVVKVHGSMNWGREVETPVEDLPNLNTWQVMYRLIDLAPELRVSSRYRVMREWPIGKEGTAAFVPAVAIPLERKSDFECPQEQMRALQQCVPEVTRLLVVGWRAADDHFVKLLADGLPDRVRGMVVAGGETMAREVVQRLTRRVRGDFVATNGGFSEFIIRREVERLLTE